MDDHLQPRQQHGVDIEASTADAGAGAEKEHLRQVGLSKLDAVLSKANAGQDPWEFQQQPRRGQGVQDGEPDDATHDPDVAAMERWLQQYRYLLLAAAFVASQGASWVLLKGSLMTMHTPAVLTFLHLLAAGLLQLVLVAYGVLPPPVVSSATAKGALVSATLSAAQVLLVMVTLLNSSVYMLVCWVTVATLLLTFTRATDISKSRILVVPARQRAWLVLACLGLGIEGVLDASANVLIALIPLLLWTAVAVLDALWKQVKVDATLGHRIMEPEFLFRARELSDLENTLNPSSKAFMSVSLPAMPVLVLGLVCLEAKDLVDHEPSVPTLAVMLLSCLVFAIAHNVQILLAYHTQVGPEVRLLQAIAAVIAVIFETMERSHAMNPLSRISKLFLLGVCVSLAGCLGSMLCDIGTVDKLKKLHM